MREAVVLFADTHINSKTGLCPPTVEEDDGDEYRQNKIQEWLWHNWLKCLEDIKKITKKYYTTVIMDGDIIDFDAKNRSQQIVSRNPTTILRMADDILEPLVEYGDRLFVIRGTEAHAGTSGWLEEMLAERYDAERDKEFGRFSWWHLRAEFSKVTFDIAHHFSTGTLPYTYSGGINRLVQVTRLNYLDWGEVPPKVVVRAHRHKYSDTGLTFSTRGVSLPCWQFHNAYLYRIGKENDIPHIGACIFLCDNGEVTQHIPLLYKPKRNQPWKRI